MPSHRWQFEDVDLFADRHDPNAETLSQAIQAALAEEPDADGSVLIGQIKGNVVGLQYYAGVVNRGEMVALVREPQNAYDRNAVMVANVNGSQVGHIKRQLAAAMAQVMDRNLARVEGVVHTGTNNVYNMPVMLSFWGKEENKRTVLESLNEHGFKLLTGGSGVTIMKTARDARGLHAPPRKVTPLTAEELKNVFDNLFEDLVESKDGEKEAAEAVRTPLMVHQKQALAWMCSCENSSALPPFWTQQGELFHNSLTSFLSKERPRGVRGGILADDMGLGKTLTAIALILTNFHQGKPLPLEKCDEQASPTKAPAGVLEAAAASLSVNSSQEQGLSVDSVDVAGDPVVDLPKRGKGKTKTKATASKAKKGAVVLSGLNVSSGAVVLLEDMDFAAALGGTTSAGPSKKKKTSGKKQSAAEPGLEAFTAEDLSARATLIVCPLSVISNWLDQFEQHVRADVKLNMYLYYGSERNRNKKFLSSQDIVLTTYNVLSADYGLGTDGNKSPLHGVSWLRVVLDEGHVVRNPSAQMSKAVLGLTSQRHWVLSGTPIQNGLKDLWMLLAFLRLKPFDVKAWWDRVIQRPVEQGNTTGLQNLQTLVKCVTLRRTKGSVVNGRPLVALPGKTVGVEQVELTQPEREEYELARSEGRNTILRYVTDGSVLRNYADVLVILMRLRQHCCHPDLLGKVSSHLDMTATPAELRERLVERLRLVLASGSDEECSVCLESVRLPVITHCAHVYCRSCIAQVLSTEQEQARCPLCRGEIKASQLVEFPQEMEEEETSQSETWRTSSKVTAMMDNLLRVREEDGSIKSLVVSQFTRFLTILETPLRNHGFSFVRLDGSLTQKRRAQVIREFQSPAPGSPVIMLLSLKAGGVGLNLTAASRVYLMDPAWNPAAEQQCVDRCHRLGQTRDVVVTKFIVKDSVEENMVKIQREKQDAVEKAFGSKTPVDRKARIDDIRALMEL